MYRSTECLECKKVFDTQDHVATECPSYDDLWIGLDLKKDADLVTFFRTVMERRAKEEEELWLGHWPK